MQLNNAVIHSTRKKGNVTFAKWDFIWLGIFQSYSSGGLPLRCVHDQHLGFLTCRPAWLWNYGFDLGRSSRGLNGSNEAFRKMIFIRHLNINHKQLGYILYILYT